MANNMNNNNNFNPACNYDMEFGFESNTHKYFMISMSRAKRLFRNKYVKIYTQLTIGLLILYLSKYFIPENIIDPEEEVITVIGDGHAKLLFSEMKWEKTLSKPLTGTRIVQDFQIEQSKDFFLKQKAQIEILKRDMSELIQQNKLACLSAMYIGLNRNIIMLIENSTNVLIMNPQITSIGNENITVEEECIVSGNTTIKSRAKLIKVDYLDGNLFQYRSNFFKDFSSICLQNHIDLLMEP